MNVAREIWDSIKRDGHMGELSIKAQILVGSALIAVTLWAAGIFVYAVVTR